MKETWLDAQFFFAPCFLHGRSPTRNRQRIGPKKVRAARQLGASAAKTREVPVPLRGRGIARHARRDPSRDPPGAWQPADARGVSIRAPSQDQRKARHKARSWGGKFGWDIFWLIRSGWEVGWICFHSVTEKHYPQVATNSDLKGLSSTHRTHCSLPANRKASTCSTTCPFRWELLTSPVWSV